MSAASAIAANLPVGDGAELKARGVLHRVWRRRLACRRVCDGGPLYYYY